MGYLEELFPSRSTEDPKTVSPYQDRPSACRHMMHTASPCSQAYHFVFAWTEGVPVMCFSVSVQAFLIAAVACSPCLLCALLLLFSWSRSWNADSRGSLGSFQPSRNTGSQLDDIIASLVSHVCHQWILLSPNWMNSADLELVTHRS